MGREEVEEESDEESMLGDLNVDHQFILAYSVARMVPKRTSEEGGREGEIDIVVSRLLG